MRIFCAYFLDFWGNARVFFLGAGENFACLGKTSEIHQNLMWGPKNFLENSKPWAKVYPKCSVLSGDSKPYGFFCVLGQVPPLWESKKFRRLKIL